MSPAKVAIAGMTGKFARLITMHLLKHPDVQITGFCRTPAKLPAEISSNPRVTIFTASSTDTDTIREAVHGADICICCYLGDETLMIDGQKALIDACIAENVPRYMDSGYTFDYRPLERGVAPQKDFCKDVAEYLEQRADRIKGVQILNGAFMEVVFAPFYGLFDAERPALRYWGSGDEMLELTTYEDAAAFAAEVAIDRDAVGYQSVLGDRKSTKEIAAAIERAYGTSIELKRLGSLDDLYAKLRATMEANPQNMYAWMGMNYNYHGLNGSTYLPEKKDADRYSNLKLTKLEDFLGKYNIGTLKDAYMF
ncbi:hypothetical protein H2200_007211 [Cladophialophora chaetospira]|uniref:NAD(P)-binding domain-containing protein n=1 Tax=Cladophialophora chaetospira TaxID=386627 RepID=A0AA38X7J2_9EURO|nr:hypothetical protein H2200_007211 [Cladophialophora chaetospira]